MSWKMFHVIQLTILIIIYATLITNSSAFCARRTSTCGQTQIDYPFWTQDYGDPRCNGYRGFQVNCTSSGKAMIHISNTPYILQNIDSARIYVIDSDLDSQQCPRPVRNFSLSSTPFLQYTSDDRKTVIFYNCSRAPADVVQNIPCLDDRRSFAFLEDQIPGGFDWYRECEQSVVIWMFVAGSTGEQIPMEVNYTQRLLYGLPLKYSTPIVCVDCEESGGQCLPDAGSDGFKCHCADDSVVDNGICRTDVDLVDPAAGGGTGLATGPKVIIGVCSGVGAMLLIFLVVFRKTLYSLYNFARNITRSPSNVEVFLESYESLALRRYSYSDIKKMTNSFKDRLGQGGYGSVFKGNLSDGRLVAVKLLDEAKGNGDEFINEVATIGRTNHVHVVNLLGFSTDGKKRALVYEFMPNGSLEKFIYHSKEADIMSNPLGWEKLYEIALGIARGLDYLHRGCNTSILHLDIKPHNILLDKDFCPKISDFGLAKLCPTKENIVSMNMPRGTIGYIAPEVYSTKFRKASHKSDVYSYGMMVLEMIGGRKNLDVTGNTSEVYLPEWIYNRLEEDIMVEDSAKFFTEEATKKMIIVALWCIQTKPTDRPSISKVVEMLEGNAQELQMPPNPFLDFPFASPPSRVSPVSKSVSTECETDISQSTLGCR